MEYRSAKVYDTLCNNNNWVQFKLKKLRNQTKDPEIRQELTECLDILRFMKGQGQHMENRLKRYVDSISALGFQRVRKDNS